jgi:hypothetical protein
MNTPPSGFQFGQARTTERGIEKIVPHQQALQVSYPDDSCVAISVVETGRNSIVFKLDLTQAQHLAALLARGWAGTEEGSVIHG